MNIRNLLLKNKQNDDSKIRYLFFDEAKTGKTKLKKKGRLPSKIIINKAGRKQLVYYRPDKETKSKYINTKDITAHDVMIGYQESFKRMLFHNHKGTTSYVRARNTKDHKWGADMVPELNKLVEKYGFKYKQFDKQWSQFVNGDPKKVKKFMQEAQVIYSKLQKKGGKAVNISFLEEIFNPTKKKIDGDKGIDWLNQSLDEIAEKVKKRHEMKKRDRKSLEAKIMADRIAKIHAKKSGKSKKNPSDTVAKKFKNSDIAAKPKRIDRAKIANNVRKMTKDAKSVALKTKKRSSKFDNILNEFENLLSGGL